MVSSQTDRLVRVGVVDSGWDRSVDHPQVGAGVCFVDSADDFAVRWSRDDRDLHGHGTATADLVLQVSPSAVIVPIRVFGQQLETSVDALVAALHWAVDHQLDVVNMSLGTRRSDALRPLYLACERARRAGVLIVASAANDEERWSYPAVFESVIGVGPADLKEPFAIVYRSGEALECGARASGQYVRLLGGQKGFVSGTSYAAPIVTGHVVRILSATGPLDVSDVRRQLERFSDVYRLRHGA